MRIEGTITLPGDKSISHRALLFASLAEGECVIHNLSTGEDVNNTKKCLSLCGINSYSTSGSLHIIGGKLQGPESALDCGNSGTTIRLLTGLLAGQGISAELTGDDSLSRRPMDRIITPLTKMGVTIKSQDGYLPLIIMGGEVKGITYEMPVASAQVKSCILLAGLGANGKSIIRENLLTRDHSEIMLEAFGAPITRNGNIEIGPLQNPLLAFDMHVPGDPSSAAFFAAAAAIIPNSSLCMKNISANPTRTGFFKILEEMGGDVRWENMRTEWGESVGDVHVTYSPLHGIDITDEIIPSIVDEIPIISILAAHADSPTTVKGAEELRVKECDRIQAICENISGMGGEIIEEKTGFTINPVDTLFHAKISTYQDHRIAMAFTIAGLALEHPNQMDAPNCVNISFPEFHAVLEGICH